MCRYNPSPSFILVQPPPREFGSDSAPCHHISLPCLPRLLQAGNVELENYPCNSYYFWGYAFDNNCGRTRRAATSKRRVQRCNVWGESCVLAGSCRLLRAGEVVAARQPLPPPCLSKGYSQLFSIPRWLGSRSSGFDSEPGKRERQ